MSLAGAFAHELPPILSEGAILKLIICGRAADQVLGIARLSVQPTA
jgi:hypothetical protein